MTMETGIRPRIVALGVTFLVLLVFTQARSAVQPKPLYAIDSSDNELAAFSLKAQTVTLIGSLGPQASDGALALAFCPSGGLVPYTIVNPFDSDAQLAILNLRTGAATRVGTPLPSDQTLDIMGMACSRDGTLYAIGQLDTGNSDFNSLYTIDRVSGQATLIGPTGVTDSRDCCGGFLMALAFAPNGKLYGVNSTSTLFTIDTSTGEATKVVDLYTAPGQLLQLVMGLAIDSRGTIYVADWVPGSRLYTVDTTTGMVTPVLNTGLNLVHNIAFRVPF
jgi:hypothetical protein